jgi:2-hydroxy-3-oxopropionate reductase
MQPTISVFGLGLMGRPMARRLIASGLSVKGWNRTELSQSLVSGIPVVPRLEEAARANVCLLMLADSRAVADVLAPIEPGLSAGQVVVDMGTSDPESSRQHAARLNARGIGWVDAPVSGGPDGAEKGSLAIMVGGSESDFTKVRPMLDALGTPVRVGEAGAGHTAKLINQVIVGLTIEAVAEALMLAEKAGLDPRLVQQALRGGYADSRILQIHGTRMLERSYVPGGRVNTHLKDLKMALHLASSVSARTPNLRTVTDLYQKLVDRGEGDLDHSALHKLLTV